MPRFDFACLECGHKMIDVQLKLHSTEVPRCLNCGSPKTFKLPSAPTFSVKGFNAANGYSEEKK